MLRRGFGITVVVAMVLGFLVAGPAAVAKECTGWADANSGLSQQVNIVCVKWTYTDDEIADSGDDSSGSGGERVCERVENGETYEMPCHNGNGTWSPRCDGWVWVQQPQPAKTEPVWEGNSDGFILACEQVDSTGYDRGVYYFWAASDPDQLLPSPRELADRALLQMEFSSGQVGSTPPSTDIKASSKGLIGVPMWFWVEDPAGTMNPQPVTETAGPITVTATPRLESVVWTLADRQTGVTHRTITCYGENARGTEWSSAIDGDGTLPSSCGLNAAQNDKPGDYELSAQANWVVEWSSGDEDGTIVLDDVPPSAAVPITISELQTIVVE